MVPVNKKTPKKKTIPELSNSEYILKQIKACIDENLGSFDKTTSETRGGKPGTHLQNFLRGTILLSCAGLDAFLKQLIRDSLVSVKGKNDKCQNYFQKVVEKQILSAQENKYSLNKKNKEKSFTDGATFIAESLLSGNPQDFVEKYVVSRLLDDSKQSYGSLQEISQAYGLVVPILKTKETEIKDLFKMRNEISHEFDIRFHKTQGMRNRIERSRTVINSNANLVYEIADNFFQAVKSELEK